MAGTALAYDLQALTRISARIDQIAGLDRWGLLDVIGATAESQTRRRIEDDKEAPDGTPWEELSKPYAARKALKSSGGLLEFEGHLLDSIGYQVSADAVEVGTNLIYGAIHQHGGAAAGRDIPARPYLGLSDGDRDELGRVIDGYIERECLT